MEACGFLLRIFLTIFLGICVLSCSCDAASACPVRAVRMVTPEGVKCVCVDAFYGEKCQFRAGNTLPINATWTGANEARVQWQTRARTESYQLFARKVMYDDVTKMPIYGKWKARALNMTGHDEVSDKGDNEDDSVEGIRVHLNQTFSWEILIIVDDDRNKSASIFIDPPMVGAFGVQNTQSSSNSSDTAEQAFDFIKFFEDFKSPCFMKGIIIGVVAGVLGTVIIGVLIYIAVRLCNHSCKKQKTKSCPSSGLCNQDSSGQKSTCPTVAIETPESDDVMSVKSLFITLPEVIEVVPKSASVLW